MTIVEERPVMIPEHRTSRLGEDLTRVLKSFDQAGWCQYTLTDQAGRHCLVGHVAAAGRARYIDTLTALATQIDQRRHLRRLDGIVSAWNDHETRTKADVRALIVTAIDQAG